MEKLLMNNISTTLKAVTLSALLATTFSGTANAKPSSNGDLKITITNLKSNSGNLVIAVYDNANAFNKGSEKVHSALSVKVTGKQMTVTLNNFPKGRYAVTAFQDINRNGDIDMKGQMPTEGYTYSKNVGAMKVPTFKDAEFTHNSNEHLVMKMIQPSS